MIVIGLTGSIGMGKSTVTRMFFDEGVPVFDADAEVHRLQGPDGALVAAIEEAFPGVSTVTGVDRRLLAARVFGDAQAVARLEAIVHPAVAEARTDFLVKNAASPLVVLDIPLLFEKGRDPLIDLVVVVSAPADLQRQRVLERPGMTPERLAAILALQMPDADKRLRADMVIENGGTRAETRAQVVALLDRLRACAASRQGG